MADKHGLTEHWLNDAASPWIPPRAKAARRRPTEPGLTVHIAPPEHVLAMKLVALRRKDRPMNSPPTLTTPRRIFTRLVRWSMSPRRSSASSPKRMAHQAAKIAISL